PPQGPHRRAQHGARDPCRHRRRRGEPLRRRALPHVYALRRAARLARRGAVLEPDRPRRLQGGHRAGGGEGRLQPAQVRGRRAPPGRADPAREQTEGTQEPARAAPRARAQRAAERDRRQPQGHGRLGRSLGEDPHLQLPPEPGDRPPGQRDPPYPGPRARRRDRPDRGRAGDAPAGRGAGGGRLMGAAAALVTVGDALAAAIARLAAAGLPEPRADAEVLLARALDTTRVGLVVAARRPLPETAARDFAALVARRAAREPLPYIVGEREFWSLPLTVDRRVLVPRPETELVVETALRLAPAARRILDVGTGSGAIAAALARELPAARVCASDLAPGALAVARANLARHA